MVLTKQQKIKYYRNRHLVEKIVRNYARRKQLLLFGGKAINLNVKEFLKSHTSDYDFLHKNPRKMALELEKILDKFFEGNYFRIMKGKHKGTFKVKSNVTNKTIADISKQIQKKIPTKNIRGLKVATAGHLKSRIRKTLKNPEASYRHEKEAENLQRLRLSENNKNTNKTPNGFGLPALKKWSTALPMTSKKQKKGGNISLW